MRAARRGGFKSGSSVRLAPHRLKDLADVQELIRIAALPRELSLALDPYVREKYLGLWQAVHDHRDPE